MACGYYDFLLPVNLRGGLLQVTHLSLQVVVIGHGVSG
jgi:hypothetical protein